VQRRFSKETSGLKNERVVGVVVATAAKSPGATSSRRTISFKNTGPSFCAVYAVEALARPTLREVAGRDSAQRFLYSLRGTIKEETGTGRVPLARNQRRPSIAIELDALEPKPLTLHRLLLHRTS